MGKVLKRLSLFVIVLLLLIVGAVVALPIFFKDEIVTAIKDTVNETIEADVNFADVDISLLKSFPRLTIDLDDLSVTGKDQFDGLDLYRAKNTTLTVNLKSAWQSRKGGPLSIKKIVLNEPEVNILVLPKGKANYEVTKDTGEASGESQFDFDLQSYEIKKGHLVYDDRSLDFFLDIQDLDHEGKGRFTETVFDLDTESEAEALTLKYGGTSYLSRVVTDLDAIFQIDTKNSKYTLKENDLSLNNLKVLVDGFIQLLPEDQIKMDLALKAPGNQFKELLSVLPSAYSKDFASVQAKGGFVLDGDVKGIYDSSKKSYPAINLNLSIDDGSIQYPGFPMAISSINLNSNIKKPTGHLDAMVVDIPAFKFLIGQDPLEGYFKLKTPMSDPQLDTKVKGLINLANLAKAYPMEGVKDLSGLIDADLLLKAALSQLDGGHYEQVDMKGNMRVQDIIYQAQNMPVVNIKSADMNFSPKYVDVPAMDIQLGKSDLKGSARIDNILAYLSPKKTMKGTVNISSKHFDVNEWIPETNTAPATASIETPTSEKPFDRFDFDMNASADEIVYDKYHLKNASLKGRATSQDITLNRLSTKIGNSDLSGSGQFNNLFGYLFDNETLHGELDVRSNVFDVNQFMTDDQEKSTAKEGTQPASNVFVVPERMDIKLAGNFKKVTYDTYDLRNVTGDILMADNKIDFNELAANLLGGKMAITGAYNTQNPAKPTFDINYALEKMQFKKLYTEMETFRALAPIAKFIDGIFNTKLKIKGALGPDMMPDLSTLTATGLLETLHGKINGLKPVEKLASQLNVSALNKLEFKNTKNWFDIKDGKLGLRPFEMDYQDINMKIDGTHHIQQGMDVNFVMKVPRKYMEQNPVGNAAGKGLDWLRGEASKLGVNINKSKYVNVNVNMGGKIDDPKLKVKLLGGSGESLSETAKSTAEQVAKKAKDSLEQVANQKLEEEKARIKKEADKAIDSAKAVVDQKVDEAVQKAKDEAAKKAKEVLDDKIGDAVGQEVEDKAKEVLDKLGTDEKADEILDKGKEILDGWNPFKKKKKKDGGK